LGNLYNTFGEKTNRKKRKCNFSNEKNRSLEGTKMFSQLPSGGKVKNRQKKVFWTNWDFLLEDEPNQNIYAKYMREFKAS
jgi:hypothetical protein